MYSRRLAIPTRRLILGALGAFTPALAWADAAFDARRALLRAADLIDRRYVDPAKGAEIASALRRDARSVPQAKAAFAEWLTGRLRTLSGDGHFHVDLRDASAPQFLDETERWYGRGVNNGFETVSRLEGGVGYLDLRVFAPLSIAADTAAAAMTLLAASPALIVDLRRNGGGHADMVAFLIGYLLDGPVEISGIYDRPTDRLTRSFTPASVPGRRPGSKPPVYVLTSRRTFSAAEQFAYDLQAMRRATIVGEQTAGGAHPFVDHDIGGGVVLSLPEGRSVNPVTGGDWEGVGITPDVVAADPLATALGLAQTAIREQVA